MNPRPRPPFRRHQFRPGRPQRFRSRPGRPQRFRSDGLARLVRRWRPDRNPLRRRWDRAETAVLGALLAAFLVGAPFAALAAGGWDRAVTTAEMTTEQATVRSVPATLLASVPSWNAYASAAFPYASARWRAPDGLVRTGHIYVPEGGAAGSTVPIWVTRSGQLANPPLRPAQVAGRAQLAAALAVAGLGVTLIIVAGMTRRRLDARRMAAWDADWLATGPHWSPRR